MTVQLGQKAQGYLINLFKYLRGSKEVEDKLFSVCPVTGPDSMGTN